jgi:ubiquinone biosynthesis protein
MDERVGPTDAAARRRAAPDRRRIRLRHYRDLGNVASPHLHWLPTPLPSIGPKKRLIYAPVRRVGRFDSLRITWIFIRLLFGNLWRKVRGRYDPADAASRLRTVLEDLGGLWVKLGQLMSLRPDVLSAAFCDELAKLQYRAVGFPPEESIGLIERELAACGTTIEAEFESLTAEPFAAASISQVHRGRLRRPNLDVIVKVMRPGIGEVFRRDIRLLRVFAGILGLLPSVKPLRLDKALAELDQIMLEESDFRYEASNMRRMRKLLTDDTVYIPKLIRRLSTQTVLVMEYVMGVLMSDYIALKIAAPDLLDLWEDENDIEPELVGQRLFLSFLRQLMEENFFHADLHPGNIILLRGSRVALIDLGSVGSVDRDFLWIYQSMLRALGQRDFGKAVDMQLRASDGLPVGNLAELRSELIRSYRAWATRAGIDALPYQERNVLAGSNEAGAILVRWGVSQNWDLIKLGRTWATLDSSLAWLYPDMNYFEIFKLYFRETSRRMLKKHFNLAGLLDQVGGFAATCEDYNMMLAPLLRKETLTFQAVASKSARIGASVVGLVQIGLIFGMLVLVYNFIAQRHAGLIEALPVAILAPLRLDLPQFDEFWWVMMLLAAIIALFTTRRMRRELLRED